MATYLLVWRVTDTGLPIGGGGMQFLAFKKVSDNSDVTPLPTITELGSGVYKFSHTPTTSVFFVVDGGPSLPAAIRYKSDVLNVQDPPIVIPVSPVDLAVGVNPNQYVEFTITDDGAVLQGLLDVTLDITGAGSPAVAISSGVIAADHEGEIAGGPVGTPLTVRVRPRARMPASSAMTMTVTARDTDGNTTVKTWSFRTSVAPMVVASAGASSGARARQVTDRIIELRYSTNVLADATLLSPSNYLISSDAVAVKRVQFIGPASGAVNRVFLELDRTPPRGPYLLAVRTINLPDGGVQALANMPLFLRGETKVDVLLRKLPRMFDKRPGSRIWAMTAALGLENDLTFGDIEDADA